jgi:hypothetical protein
MVLPSVLSRSAVLIRPLLALGLLAGALAPQAAHAQVRSPAQGVLCDSQALRGGGVCYDSKGASATLTGQYLGRRAEAQLSVYLANNPAPLEFRLSNGIVCSVPARTCWEDGWNKRNVAQKVTGQLFASSNPYPQGPDSSGDGWNASQAARDTGLCSLSRGGRPLFDGRCDLRQMSRGDGQIRYRVRLNNGTTYMFTTRGGSVTIADDFGSTWPVSYLNHGSTGIFRWADMSLVATQMAGRSSSSPSPSSYSSGNEELGRAIGTLLNTLFR